MLTARERYAVADRALRLACPNRPGRPFLAALAVGWTDDRQRRFFSDGDWSPAWKVTQGPHWMGDKIRQEITVLQERKSSDRDKVAQAYSRSTQAGDAVRESVLNEQQYARAQIISSIAWRRRQLYNDGMREKMLEVGRHGMSHGARADLYQLIYITNRGRLQ